MKHLEPEKQHTQPDLEAQVKERLAELQASNIRLQQEIDERQSAQEDLQTAYAELEQRFESCSAALQQTKDELQGEIEERRYVENGLSELKRIIETIPLGVTITDITGKITYVNSAEAKMHDYTVEEIIGCDVGIFAPNELRKQRTLEEIVTMKNWVRESMNIRKNGSRFPVYLMSDVVKDEYGKPRAIVTISEDITERKRTEEALVEERNLLRALIDNLPDHIYLKDLDGRFLLNNRSHSVFLGAERSEELIGNTDIDFYPEELAMEFSKNDRHVIQSETSLIGHEESIPAQDGTIRNFLTTKVPFRNNRGDVVGLVGMSHDISERKQAEAKIEHLNAVLNAIRNVNQLIVREKDKNLLIKTACEHLVRARGYTSAWIVLLDATKQVIMTASAGEKDFIQPLIAAPLMQGNFSPYLQQVFSQPEATLLPTESVISHNLLLTNAGREYEKVVVRLEHDATLYGVLCVSLPMDIHFSEEEQGILEEIARDLAFALYNLELEDNRRKTEKAIREHERWLAATLRNLSEAVITTDEKGVVTFFNPAAEELTGWKQEEVLGKDIAFKTISEEQRMPVEKVLPPSLRREITIILAKQPLLITKRGKALPIEYNGNSIKDEQGCFVGFVLIFKDITERLKAKAELERSLSLLRSTLESTADGILVMDAEGQITLFNQVLVKMWQIPDSFMLSPDNKRILMFVMNQVQHSEGFLKMIHNLRKRPKLERYDSITCKDGRVIEIFSHPQWIGETCVGTVTSFRDITERKQAEEALRYRIKFSHLINTISTHFIHLGSEDDVNQGIYNALQSIGEFTGMDHGYVARYFDDETRMEVTNEWWFPALSSELKSSKGLKISTSSWAKEILEQEGILHIPCFADIPPDVFADQERTQKEREQSLLVLPLISGGNIFGLLGVESLRQKREWSEEVIALLRIVAEMFANAFERKRSQGALEHERQRLFSLLEKLPVYVYLQAPDYSIRFANRHFREHFGEPDGRRCYKMLWGRETLWEEGPIFQVFQSNTPQKWEWNHYPSGKIYQVYDYPFTDFDGSPLVLELGIDITERKQMELALEEERASLAEKVEERTVELSTINKVLHKEITERRQAQFELEEAKEAAEFANLAKSEFLANMSHELRTPLNAILGYAQILKNAKNLEERQKEILDIVESSGNHLLNLINEILDLSKIEAGRMELHMDELDLPYFLKRIAEMILIRAKQKGILFVYEEDPQLPAGVWADENRLRQILFNLLDNAVKFTEEGRVTFTVNACRRHISDSSLQNIKANTMTIHFEVKDTGIGIVPEKLEEIFLPFQQVGERRHSIQGTGLGLTISYNLVNMMQSELRVESSLGKGTTFQFDLLLEEIPDYLPKLSPEERRIIGYEGEQRTVLVVDDRKANRALLRDLLLPLGFQVLEAENGRVCIEQMLEHSPDVILLDLRMPVMNGIETVQQIRQNKIFHETIIIAVSASAYEDDRKESLQVGCNDFLTKPIHLEELLSLLQKYLSLAWVYEETIQEPSPKDESIQVHSSSNIVLPAKDREVLLKFAASGRVKPLLEYLADIEERDPKYQLLTEEIRRFAKMFQLKAVIEKLQ